MGTSADRLLFDSPFCYKFLFRRKPLKKFFVAGHNGMVGSAICRQLDCVPNVEVLTKSRHELDLRDQPGVEDYLNEHKPDAIVIAAAKVGGIHANKAYPADFIYDNLQIQNALIHSAHKLGIERLLFLGSSCIYPKFAGQPIKEAALLSGHLEESNEAYAIAKIAGIKLCQSYNLQYGRDYRCIMPTNLYGPNDNYHATNSHVVPALLRRFHEAKIVGSDVVTVWGDGTPLRELMYVDDLAKISVDLLLMEESKFKCALSEGVHHINVGSGIEVSISDLANIIKHVVGYMGEISFDNTKPNGTPRKVLDCKRLGSLLHYDVTDLMEGLKYTYNSYASKIK